MKLVFEKEKQRELLKKEKEINNFSWLKFAKQLNIKASKLKTYYHEGILIDEEIFNRFTLKKDYEKFIVNKLSNNWGQSKGGKNSIGNLKEIKIPNRTKELAELFGILLGDGNIQRTSGYKLGTYNIKIVGHSILDKEYLLNFVKPLVENLFNVKVRVYESKTCKGLNIVADSRRIVDFFEKEGFKAGDKIRNQVAIPNWIKENPEFLAACLRGLHDTDGCFYKLTNQNSYQIGFTNHNSTLLHDSRNGLLSLGIGVSKIMDNRKYVITKKSEIAKFYKSIGFHNSKHLNKIRAYFKAL
ncbi:MAG: LAGLIDADG family homing endonuclease [Nanoarchaeota archaeon]